MGFNSLYYIHGGVSTAVSTCVCVVRCSGAEDGPNTHWQPIYYLTVRAK